MAPGMQLALLILPLAGTAALAARPQVRRIRESRTGTSVILVGTMHYNPASVALAQDIVSEEQSARRLHTVVVESCPKRWDATERLQPPGSVQRSFFADELLAAADAANCATDHNDGRASVNLAFGDQRIARTVRRCRVLGDLTLQQLATPWTGGWKHIWHDLSRGLRCMSGDGGQEQPLPPPPSDDGDGVDDGPIGFRDVIEPRLLGGFAIAWVRSALLGLLYGPAALRGLLVACGALLVADHTGAGFCDPAAAPETWRWCVAALSDPPPGVGVASAAAVDGAGGALPPALSVLDVTPLLDGAMLLASLVLLRVGLVGLVEERNYVLARNIRAACRRAWKDGGSHGGSHGADRSVVVAVVGLAHVNGVSGLLRRWADVEMVCDLHDDRGRTRGQQRAGDDDAGLEFVWPDEQWVPPVRSAKREPPP